MHFPAPVAAKITKDGKFRLSMKVGDGVIIVRDLSLEEARSFLALAQAVLRETETQDK